MTDTVESCGVVTQQPAYITKDKLDEAWHSKSVGEVG